MPFGTLPVILLFDLLTTLVARSPRWLFTGRTAWCATAALRALL